jgi:ribosomal protein S18 acetylase RimI-like enzyme
MKLRRATQHDADEIVALWKRAGATASVTDRPDDVRRAAARDEVAFVIALSDDGEARIIGSIIGTFDGWRGNIYRLAVDPAHRRRGVARALVAEVERAFSGWGVRRITALVERDHPWAVSFWRAAGYLLDERMDRYVRML